MEKLKKIKPWFIIFCFIIIFLNEKSSHENLIYRNLVFYNTAIIYLYKYILKTININKMNKTDYIHLIFSLFLSGLSLYTKNIELSVLFITTTIAIIGINVYKIKFKERLTK